MAPGQLNLNRHNLLFWAKTAGLLSWLFYSCVTLAVESILITDQHGSPLDHVVVTIPAIDLTEKNALPALMDQVDMQFLPHVLTINRGQAVVFPNSDNTRHHIYSFSKAKPFEIKMFSGGESKQLTFEQPGLVVLGCNIHDQMLGYIYVADNQYTLMSNQQGLVQLPAPGLAITLWHPELSTNKSDRINIQLPNTVTEQPFKIMLTLEANVTPPSTNTFKSRKFSKGN